MEYLDLNNVISKPILIPSNIDLNNGLPSFIRYTSQETYEEFIDRFMASIYTRIVQFICTLKQDINTQIEQKTIGYKLESYIINRLYFHYLEIKQCVQYIQNTILEVTSYKAGYCEFMSDKIKQILKMENTIKLMQLEYLALNV